ncbi:hypothetical protein EBN88_21815 [Streptomyces triticirhizae]|uniref:Uncharacterized protein n=1 Tax=Streptomyces triticirhizae TaxID=2483353 RepID=A0A3M2LJY1_9ACTN|nr:hypothetical protein EBN88_21815 [Streptomyces triticirhizae]
MSRWASGWRWASGSAPGTWSAGAARWPPPGRRRDGTGRRRGGTGRRRDGTGRRHGGRGNGLAGGARSGGQQRPDAEDDAEPGQ